MQKEYIMRMASTRTYNSEEVKRGRGGSSHQSWQGLDSRFSWVCCGVLQKWQVCRETPTGLEDLHWDVGWPAVLLVWHFPHPVQFFSDCISFCEMWEQSVWRFPCWVITRIVVQEIAELVILSLMGQGTGSSIRLLEFEFSLSVTWGKSLLPFNFLFCKTGSNSTYCIGCWWSQWEHSCIKLCA